MAQSELLLPHNDDHDVDAISHVSADLAQKVDAISHVSADLAQTISHFKSSLISGQTPLGFDLFEQHWQSLRALKELIAVYPAVGYSNSDSEQKTENLSEREQRAVEALVLDIGLPFLQSFAPSYDGRADLAAAVLKVCDFIFVCLKRSSYKTTANILELCLQSFLAFHRECSRHSESASTGTLDILCALELLGRTLEISVAPEYKQNEDLFDKIFLASLSVLPHLKDRQANRLISFVILKLTQEQVKKKSMYRRDIWMYIEGNTGEDRLVTSKSLQVHLTIMCSLADLFFPLTDEPVTPDVKQYSTFWELIQCGLYDDNPAVRKRSIYLMKRIVDICEKSGSDFNSLPLTCSLKPGFAAVPHFWWKSQLQKNLSKLWEDIFLLLETLDEKQTHVIKPILPRMQTVISAAKKENGSFVLHTSWIVTLLMRAFYHESIFIVRWATETVLFMDFCSLPFMEQGQLQCLTQKLLGFLQDLRLYQRPDGSPVDSCSRVGTGLKYFFGNVLQSLDNKQNKVEFLQYVLLTLGKENWSSVPLVFITQGLSYISPDALLDQQSLASIREIIIASLTTLETFTRGAIECFMTQTVLNLIDKSIVGIEELMETLAVMEREESLQRGTGLWSTVVSWLVTTTADPLQPTWAWSVLYSVLHSMLDAYLTVAPDGSGNVLSESLRVTRIGRLVMLMADCENTVTGLKQARQDLSAGDRGTKSLLTDTVGRTVDIINSINTRAYMPVLKTDRAIYLLLTCAKESRKDKERRQDYTQEEVCQLAQSCWSELLLYIERRTMEIGLEHEETGDLELVMFYTDAVRTLGGMLPYDVGVQSLHRLLNSCVHILEPATAKPLQRVAAISLMSAVAQVMEMKLKQEREEKDPESHEGLKQLSTQLVTFNMLLDSDVIPVIRSGGTAHQGRLVCQYMMSQWQCLRVLLSLGQHVFKADQILHAGEEAFSVSSGETDITIIQCLEFVIPQLANQVAYQEKVIEVMEISWMKVNEEIKSWSFWLKMEAFINMVLQRPLLMLASVPSNNIGIYMTKVLERFFDMGQDKAGLLNLVMTRLCQLWTGTGGITLARVMVHTLVDACMFGTLHKKTERLWLDVCIYIETLKETCSVNEILSSSTKNDIYVRLLAVNFLSTLRPGVADEEMLARAVLHEVWNRYWTLAQLSTFRQYTNTLAHRQKHRLVHILPLLDQFIDQDCCFEFSKKIWDGLVVECHPSVRQNLEWLVMRLVQRFPSQLLPFLWDYFDQFSDKRNVSLLSLLHILARLGPELPAEFKEDFYMQAVPLVVPWTMAHHFNTRLHGQAAIYQLWKQFQQMQLNAKQFDIVDNCVKFLRINTNSSGVLDKLLGNYFYSHFHFLQDYSMETLFYTLPKLACLSDDEWMHPDLFHQQDPSWQSTSSFRLMPLYNHSKALAACEPGPWKMKATAESIDDVNKTTDGDVQKKIIPWRLMTPDGFAEQEYSSRKKGHRSDGLILVASLISKVPNLGGLCRTSEIFGVSEFVISNLSYLNDRTFQSLSVTAEKWIPVTEVPSFRLREFLEHKRRESYTLVGVEQTANSLSLTDYKFPKKTLLILGNEKEGITPDLLQLLDVCVEIPQQGIIRSLNVHVSGALLIWEYTRQQVENINE